MSNWADSTSPAHHPDPAKEAVHHLLIAETHVATAIRALTDLPIAKDEAQQIQAALLAMVDHTGIVR